MSRRNLNVGKLTCLRPRTLDLSASDELVVFDNLDILKSNGFDIQIDEDATSGNRCQLVSLPLSKSTVFDLKGRSY